MCQTWWSIAPHPPDCYLLAAGSSRQSRPIVNIVNIVNIVKVVKAQSTIAGTAPWVCRARRRAAKYGTRMSASSGRNFTLLS